MLKYKTVCPSVKLSICSCVNASIRPSILISIHSFIHISIISYIHHVHPTNFSFFSMSFHLYIQYPSCSSIFFSFICPLIHIYILFINFFFFHMFMKIKNIPLGITEGSVLKRRSRQSAADCFTTSSVSLNNTNILSKHTLKLL